VTFVYELQDEGREEAYGIIDPFDCIKLDLDLDAPAFFAEQAEDVRLVMVTEAT
jgi:hypothetical protein